MENQAGEQQSYEDVQKSGYLRKHKSMHRRFFVLRAASEQGPARLEYYENEKKFRSKSPVPKKTLNLETCFNINKRADSKNKHMIVLYTRSESFAIAADTEEVQDEWYQAMLDLQCNCKMQTTGVLSYVQTVCQYFRAFSGCLLSRRAAFRSTMQAPHTHWSDDEPGLGAVTM